MQKGIVKFLSQILPRTMARLAYKTLTNPQVKKLREHEAALLDQAEKNILPFREFEIQTYTWGNPQYEKILLIHGWEGQAGNFSDIVPKLLSHNYYVISFDGPSHGFSSKGSTSLFEFSELVGKMIRDFECKKLISHSFGGVATTYALFQNPDISIDKYALLTTPDKFRQRVDDVAAAVGITEKVKEMLIRRLETELEVDTKQFNVSNFVKKIQVKRALIIHDKNDKVISLAQSQHVCQNWPVCELIEVEGTGHFRILRTEKVIDTVLEFLDDEI